ncbi:MAG: hypothetical protein GFH24_608294n136 [Chloroflexi bacterium AL-N5]|nr:hypothetical protein [Chloroflexi bacterium AL-N5]
METEPKIGPDLIAQYRRACRPSYNQKQLAQELKVGFRTVQGWEKDGVAKAHDLFRLVAFFIEQGVITSRNQAEYFWYSCGRQRFTIPAELNEVLDELSSAEHTLAALPTDSVPKVQSIGNAYIPFHPNRLFIGRTQAFKHIATALKQHAAIVVINGLAGMGKTQLAGEFAYRYGNYFAGGVFWIHFGEEGSISDNIVKSVGDAGTLLDLPADFAKQALPTQAALVQQAWCDPVPRLLIFDNCEEERLLRQYVPRTGGCRILVTSRYRKWDPTLVHPVPLGVLRREESTRFLSQHYVTALGGAYADEKSYVTEDDWQSFDEIAAELGDLPLALHFAAMHIAANSALCPPSDYLRELREVATLNCLQSTLQHESLQEGVAHPTNYEYSLERTFAITYNRFCADDPTDALALKLLARAAYFARGEVIPQQLLVATLTPPTEQEMADPSTHTNRALINRALQRLINELGFLYGEARHGKYGKFRLHRLVVDFVRQIDPDAEAQAAVEQTLITQTRQAEEKRMPVSANVLTHLRGVADTAKVRKDTRAAELCEVLSWQLYQQCQFVDGMQYIEWAYAVNRSILGEKHPVTIENLEIMALTAHISDDYPQAIKLYDDVLALRLDICGTQHNDTATAYDNAGFFFAHAGGDLIKAYDYLKTAVEIRHSLNLINSIDMAYSIRNLGCVCLWQGKYRRAERYLKLAWSIFQQYPDGYLISKAQTLMYFGELAFRLGDYARAQAYHQESLLLRRKAHRAQNNDIAESLWHLGRVHYTLGNYVQAKAHFTEALEVNTGILSTYNMEVIRIHSYLGLVALAQDQYQESRDELTYALKQWEASLGEDHWETATALFHLLAQLGGDKAKEV